MSALSKLSVRQPGRGPETVSTERSAKNKQGIILLTVLSVTAIMMIFVIGIVSTNVSQITIGQRQIDRIKNEQWQTAINLYYFDLAYRGITFGGGTYPLSLDGKDYTITAGYGTAGSGLSGTLPIISTSSNY